jgi:hypothetical protein
MFVIAVVAYIADHYLGLYGIALSAVGMLGGTAVVIEGAAFIRGFAASGPAAQRETTLRFGSNPVADFQIIDDQTIEVRTLDAFAAAQNLTRLDFLKADVEGGEARMLMGGMKTLSALKPKLFLELVQSSLARADTKAEDVFALLAPLGYRARKLRADATLIETAAFDGDSDYLFEV